MAPRTQTKNGGTTMTELEKRAYAYVIERQKDANYPVYNWETEITDAYEQGYKDAIDKACEWLTEKASVKIVEDFKKQWRNEL